MIYTKFPIETERIFRKKKKTIDFWSFWGFFDIQAQIGRLSCRVKNLTKLGIRIIRPPSIWGVCIHIPKQGTPESPHRTNNPNISNLLLNIATLTRVTFQLKIKEKTKFKTSNFFCYRLATKVTLLSLSEF